MGRDDWSYSRRSQEIRARAIGGGRERGRVRDHLRTQDRALRSSERGSAGAGRIQPRYPRPKGDRRDRKRSRPHAAHEAPPRAAEAETGSNSTDLEQEAPVPSPGHPARTRDSGAGRGTVTGRPLAVGGPGRRKPAGDGTPQESTSFDPVTTASIEEQVRLAEDFLQGLLSELGAQATITSSELSNEVGGAPDRGGGPGDAYRSQRARPCSPSKN